METWLISAIISIFFLGFFSFGMKVIAQRNYNTSFVSFIGYCVVTLFSLIYFLINNSLANSINGISLLILIASSSGLLYFFSTLTRVESLKNIDTTIFFPLYKTFMPIIAILASFFIFAETLTTKQIIGVIVGIMIPLILITKDENKTQKNLKLGLIFIVLTSVLASFSSSIPKVVYVESLNPDLFVFFSSLAGLIISWCTYFFGKKKNPSKKYSTKGIYKIGFVLGIMSFVGFLTYVYSLEGNLAIAVTINSFSILIPIILSVIFYKEEMTYKKAFVILLSIVSVILFI